jgi:hypothetical protein
MTDKKVTYDAMLDLGDDEIRNALVGWTVAAVGLTKGCGRTYGDGQVHHSQVEGGLTLILYKDGMLRKVILGYTELGQWLEYLGEL